MADLNCTCQPKDSGEAPDMPDEMCPVHGAEAQRDEDETVWAINPAVEDALRAMMELFDGPVGRIMRERVKQIGKGYDRDHDARHDPDDLNKAAIAYLWAGMDDLNGVGVGENVWPWEADAFRSSDDRLRNLEKAGALVVAAIECEMNKRGMLEEE
jgi:hypothetical protein